MRPELLPFLSVAAIASACGGDEAGPAESEPAGGTGGTAGRSSGGRGGAAGQAAKGGGAGQATGGASATGGVGSSGGAASGGGGGTAQPSDPCAARVTTRNLFSELLGKTDAEVDAQIDAVYQSLFHGGSDATVYYESGADEAYILDVNSGDVRTEGMSYGMMITVQLDQQAEFDRIWKWARTHMYQSSGAMAGYFAWQCNTSGQVVANYSAPDGEEYFATALLFASKRWGDGSGIFAYSTEAKNLLDALKNKGDFNQGNHLVTFGNSGASAQHTDASYVLPAFYQTWACFDTKNAQFWRDAVTAGRNFFHVSTHATTGLAPNQSSFDGSAFNGSYFQSDAWRVVGNIMMDHNFYAADPWQLEFAARYAAFFESAPAGADQFQLNGSVAHDNGNKGATGLVAQNGLVAFGLPAEEGTPFVQALWDLKPPTGQYRYYDGMLLTFGLMHASGRFRLYY